jgi:hypothetical protein
MILPDPVEDSFLPQELGYQPFLIEAINIAARFLSSIGA